MNRTVMEMILGMVEVGWVDPFERTILLVNLYEHGVGYGFSF